MFEFIKNFIFNLSPDIIVQVPERIILINPIDTVEGDFWIPLVAINEVENALSAFVYIKRINNKSQIKIY